MDEKPLAAASRALRRLERQGLLPRGRAVRQISTADPQPVPPVRDSDAQRVLAAMNRQRRLAAAIQRRVNAILTVAPASMLTRLEAMLSLFERGLERNHQRRTPRRTP